MFEALAQFGIGYGPAMAVALVAWTLPFVADWRASSEKAQKERAPFYQRCPCQ